MARHDRCRILASTTEKEADFVVLWLPGTEAAPIRRSWNVGWYPFAAVVLAHLKTVETRHEPGQRRDWKIRLVKSLFDRGLSAEEIRRLFRLIAWLMDLPREFAEESQEQIHRFEEEMPYVTSIERMALEKGLHNAWSEANFVP